MKKQNWLKNKDFIYTYPNIKIHVGTPCFCDGLQFKKVYHYSQSIPTNFYFKWPEIMFQRRILKCKSLRMTTTDEDYGRIMMTISMAIVTFTLNIS